MQWYSAPKYAKFNVGWLFNILIICIYFPTVDLSTNFVADGKKFDSTCRQRITYVFVKVFISQMTFSIVNKDSLR